MFIYNFTQMFLRAYLNFRFYCCDKTSPKAAWERKCLLLVPVGFITEGSRGRNLEDGTDEAEATEQLLTGLLSLLYPTP